MARLIIESEANDARIELIIGPQDAFKLLAEYGNKYPNKINKFPTFEEFLDRWCGKQK